MKSPVSATAVSFLSSISLGGSLNLLGLLRHLWPLLLPLFLLASALGSFPYPSPEAPYSDLTISHYPNAMYLREALLTYRSLPLWSPTILSGYPFAANPLSGLWYPGGWLALLLPLPFGFNLLVGLHILWGGIGLYLFLRSVGMKAPAALLGALAFEAMPKIFAHYGAGHITLLYAISWTPWLLLASDAGHYQMGHNHKRRAFIQILPAVILALVLLADVRWGAYAALLWWGYALLHHRRAGKSNYPDGAVIQGARRDSGIGGQIWQLLLLTVLALLLAAPLVLPLVEYTSLSTRSSLTAQDVMAFSLPPIRLLGLFFPDLGGFHEWIIYPGWVVLSLGLLAVIWRHNRKRAMFWVWVAILSLVYALGEYLPVVPLLAHIPGFDLLRVPPRSLFLFGIALAILAGYGLDTLLSGILPIERQRANLLFVFLIGFCVAISGLTAWISDALPIPYIWGLTAMLATIGWLWLMMSGRLASGWSLAGLLVLCLVDLGGVNRSLFTPRPVDSVLSQGSKLVEYLSEQPGTFRVYSPSYSLPQQSAVHGNLSLADGVDPLQLTSYASYMEAASGVPSSGYSVTLPPFGDGDPASANAAYLPRPDLLGLLNVRYVAAEFDIAAPGLSLSDQLGSTRIYENSAFRPPAWVQPAGSPDGEYALVESIRWEPNRVEVLASGPGLLVISEINYPGWQVWIDGERKELQPTASILRAVNLPPGEHNTSFLFRPFSIYLGIGLASLGVVMILFIGLRSLRADGYG